MSKLEEITYDLFQADTLVTSHYLRLLARVFV